MRIGVISDTHGSVLAMKRAVKAIGSADLWLHAGDCSQDVLQCEQLSGSKVITAAGNCDGRSAIGKADEFITVGTKKIWLTHGHRHSVKSGHHELAWWAKQYGMDAVIYGHTHIPQVAWVDTLLVFNPGSAAEPRSNMPTCGVIEITDDNLTGTIIKIK